MTCKKKSFDNLIILQNFRFIAHTVGFCNGTDYPTRISGCEGIIRNIFCDNAPGTDNTVVSDCDAGANDHACSKPTVISDFDRFGITHVLGIAIFVCDQIPFAGQQRMNRCYDSDIRAKIIIIADFDESVILYGKIEIGKKVFANGSVPSVMKENR